MYLLINKIIFLIILYFKFKCFCRSKYSSKDSNTYWLSFRWNFIELDPFSDLSRVNDKNNDSVAFDLIKNNKISLDDKFAISENAWRLSQTGYSSMFIMINDQVTVKIS